MYALVNKKKPMPVALHILSYCMGVAGWAKEQKSRDSEIGPSVGLNR